LRLSARGALEKEIAMDWQLTLTCVTVALAGAYLLWRGRRALRSNPGGCSGGCGCVKAKDAPQTEPRLIAPEQIMLRRRPTQTND
jgi:hypothetical protein